MADSIAVQTAQAAGMSALSNIIAQYFAAYQTKVIALLAFCTLHANDEKSLHSRLISAHWRDTSSMAS